MTEINERDSEAPASERNSGAAVAAGAARGGRIVLAGGSGFLGRVLAGHLAGRGFTVRVLTRNPQGDGERSWDGRTLGGWVDELEGAVALINLAGCSVDCRYHARNRKRILDSRVESTRVLGEALARCAQPPRVWLNASTATIYKHSLDQPRDEAGELGSTPEAKDAFSIEVATAWERALTDAPTTHRTRKVALRTAMVLGSGANSVLPTLRRLVRCGLGGAMAGGRQFVSWIHEEDFCRALDWLLDHPELEGPVNVASPHPLRNREMMSLLRRSCGRRFGLPASGWMLEVGAFLLRTETELMLKSRCVVPGRLLATGFRFLFPHFTDAVADLSRSR